MPAGFRLQTRASPGRGQAGKAPGLVLTHILQVKQNLQRQHRARQQRRDWRQDRAPPSAPAPSFLFPLHPATVTSGRFPLVPLPPRRFGPLAPLTGIRVPSASHTPPPSRSVHPSRSGRGDRAENSHLTTAPESCPLDQVRTPSGSGPCNRSSLPAALARPRSGHGDAPSAPPSHPHLLGFVACSPASVRFLPAPVTSHGPFALAPTHHEALLVPHPTVRAFLGLLLLVPRPFRAWGVPAALPGLPPVSGEESLVRSARGHRRGGPGTS